MCFDFEGEPWGFLRGRSVRSGVGKRKGIYLLEKLATLVPPPRVNQVLYHRVRALRAKCRQERIAIISALYKVSAAYFGAKRFHRRSKTVQFLHQTPQSWRKSVPNHPVPNLYAHPSGPRRLPRSARLHHGSHLWRTSTAQASNAVDGIVDELF